MSRRLRPWVRAGLGALAAVGLLVGLWAGLAPRSFYDDFPGLGRVWIAVDGPYNEHFVRDVGWLNLALAALAVWASVVLARALVLAALVAWLVASLPHLAYHLGHLDGLATADRVGEVVSLGIVPAVAGLLLVAVARSRPAGSSVGAG